jgi:hypothetical protein
LESWAAAAEQRQCGAGLAGQRADGSAIKLVNAPSFQLQNGHAKVPDLVGCG